MYIGLQVVIRIAKCDVQLEGEFTIRGELTDQQHVGSRWVYARLVRQGGPCVVDELQGAAVRVQRGQLDVTTDVVRERRCRTRDAAVVPRETRENTTSGEVTIRIQVATDAQLCRCTAASDRTASNTG